MNISLKARVAASFITANAVILILAFTVFNFLNSLSQDIKKYAEKSNTISFKTDEIRISAISILKYQRRLLTQKVNPELVKKILDLCESFIAQLNSLDSLYEDPKVKQKLSSMLTYVDSLKLILNKAAMFSRDSGTRDTVGDLADRILESFSDFQEFQYAHSSERDNKIKYIIKETKKNMMLALIVGFLGTFILGLVVPGKIALPFKKINDAIRELQDCNFDVSIYYNQDDEIGEIAREMNKMILSFKRFEELRQDRISVERRKFDALANMLKRPVLVANAEGKLIYMNNQLYSLLEVQSDDFLGKNMAETRMPSSIIDTYELAIKRRSKIENAEIVIPQKTHEDEDLQKNIEEGELPPMEVEAKFKGFANVIPIRGKESSLDYYLMILSQDVFS